MTNDGMQSLISEHIDYLLSAWHRWSAHQKQSCGYPRTAAGCGQYRASRQYDDYNGAMDLDADMAECQAVDNIIQRIEQTHNAALHMEARCLATARVWRSGRLDQADAAKVVAEARQMLWDGLQREGVA